MAKDIKGFTFYKSYFDTLNEFEEEEQKDLIYAMVKFVFGDEEQEFEDKSMRIAWTLIKPLLEKSKNKSNSNSGAPIGNQNARKYEENEKQSKNNQMYQDISLSKSISNSISKSYINSNIDYNSILSNNILIELFNEYLEFRESIKLSNSKMVQMELLDFLKEYNDKEKEKIIKKAIKNGWKEFYPVNERKEAKEEKIVYETI